MLGMTLEGRLSDQAMSHLFWRTLLWAHANAAGLAGHQVMESDGELMFSEGTARTTCWNLALPRAIV